MFRVFYFIISFLIISGQFLYDSCAIAGKPESRFKQNEGRYERQKTGAQQFSDSKTYQRRIHIGWTEPVPSIYDASSYSLTDLKQPGSRIYYINSKGNDSTAEIYFWNGKNIVDSSGSQTGEGDVEYGTDPMNPTGPIKPFKRWSYVAPRYVSNEDIGSSWDGKGYQVPGGFEPKMRYEYPDWWLFKRGDSFDLHRDYLSFVQETNPGITEVKVGSLAVSGGRSESQRQIVGAYGSLIYPRPRFINPPNNEFIARWDEPSPKHIAYLSLHFDGRGSRRGGGFRFSQQKKEAVNILLEDLWIDGTQGSAFQKSSAQLTLRRTLITDSWKEDGSHVQGLYLDGKRDAVIRIEECIFLRNGFSRGDPQATGWPPTGSQYFDIYNRNLYLGGECNSMESWVFNTVSMIGASGDQIRSGMRVEQNFFYQGYVEMGANGGYPDSYGPTGTMIDNVLQRFRGTGTNDNRGHPGWGFHLTSGAFQVEVAGNIVTGAQYPEDRYGFLLDALHWYCYSHTFHYPTRENKIHNNIFDTASATSAIEIVDGVEVGDLSCSNWVYPGIKDNVFDNNILINKNRNKYEYRPKIPASGTNNDSVFSNNKIYKTKAEAAKTERWPNPNCTLRTYLISLGYSVNAGSDGFLEYYNKAIQMRKGNWKTELTSRSLVNYFREGFGLTTLP